MSTLTEIVASVVVHSSAVAFSHFGVQIEAPKMDRPQAERVITRTPAPRKVEKLSERAADCPDQQRAKAAVVKV